MTHDELARIALRYDTSLSHAMLRALGVPVPHRRPKPGTIARVDRYEGMADLMRQTHGVRL